MPSYANHLLNEADEHLMKFCIQFETIFGPEKVTPNMHLHGHLKKCVIDVGPVHSFWCFSFERYNGMLENMQKNWHSPEVQVMQKFVTLHSGFECYRISFYSSK